MSLRRMFIFLMEGEKETPKDEIPDYRVKLSVLSHAYRKLQRENLVMAKKFHGERKVLNKELKKEKKKANDLQLEVDVERELYNDLLRSACGEVVEDGEVMEAKKEVLEDELSAEKEKVMDLEKKNGDLSAERDELIQKLNDTERELAILKKQLDIWETADGTRDLFRENI